MKKVLMLGLVLISLAILGFIGYQSLLIQPNGHSTFGSLTAGNKNGTVELAKLEGTWVNEQYIQNIKKYQSPIQAVQRIQSYPSFRLFYQAVDRKWILDVAVAFHQGLGGEVQKTTRLAGDKYRISLRDSQKHFDLQWVTANATTQKVFLIGKDQASYIKIAGTVEEYVNDLLLAGDYQDSMGRRYRFSQSQLALWLGRSFYYRLNLDPVFTRNDYLVDESDQKRLVFYCFEWRKQNLYIYHANVPEGSEQIKKDPQPYLILKKRV